MKRWGLLLLKIVVTSGLLAWLFSTMDLTRTAEQLSRADFRYLAATLMAIWFGHLLCVIRWKLLLTSFRMILKTMRLVLIYGIGMFFNLVFPGLVGGDVVKIYLAGRDSGQPYSLAFASVFLDRWIGFVAMIVVAVTATSIYPVSVQGYNLRQYFLGMLAIVVVGNLILFHPGSHSLGLRLFSLTGLERFIQKIHLLFEAFSKVRHRPLLLGGAFFLSLINHFVVIIASWMVALSLDIHAPFRYFLVFIPATIAITMIPISINGVGLREFAFKIFFTTIGISQEEGVLIGFLTSVMIILSGLPGLVAYMFHKQEIPPKGLSAYKAELAQGSELS